MNNNWNVNKVFWTSMAVILFLFVFFLIIWPPLGFFMIIFGIAWVIGWFRQDAIEKEKELGNRAGTGTGTGTRIYTGTGTGTNTTTSNYNNMHKSKRQLEEENRKLRELLRKNYQDKYK